MTAPTVCLIGPGHLASNPRLVKEADALHAAGYRVRVVSGTSHPLVEPLDLALTATRPWAATRVRLGSRWRRLPGTVRQKLAAKSAWAGGRRAATAAWAESAITGRLARAAAAVPADLYVGHYLPGLFAAWRAARRHGTAYGFDIEDSHVDELPDTAEHSGRRASRERLERELLPGCRHLTASSPQIAERYRDRYGVSPTTVLNVFPLAEAPPQADATEHLRGRGPAKLYWFSQTVGPGRGLEAIVAAVGRMRVRAELHLRGIPAAGYQTALNQDAAGCGAAGRVVWHPPAEPDRMPALCAAYDLGLALEQCEPPNRAICLTNKAFTYLLAGVPTVFSPTPAQAWLASQLGEAGLLIGTTDAAATARAIDDALGDRDRLLRRREAARAAARERFNWEREGGSFLRVVEHALGGRFGPNGSP